MRVCNDSFLSSTRCLCVTRTASVTRTANAMRYVGRNEREERYVDSQLRRFPRRIRLSHPTISRDGLSL